MKPAVFLTALLLSASCFGASYIYRWVDDEAHVHYTETPPPDRAFEKLRSDTAIMTDDRVRAGEGSGDESSGDGGTPASPSDAAPAAPSAIDANREFLRKAEAENKAAAQAKAKQDKERAALDARCKQGKDRLAFLDTYSSHRLATVDDNGEVSRYTEEDYARERTTAEKAIADSCR